MSIAPLVEQHEAKITEFYVRPPMMAYNKPNAFGQKKQSDEKSGEKKSEEKTNIRSYRELLLNGNDPYKGIYVTADAGMGKTYFAKMLAVTWCEAHASKDRLIRKRLEKQDIETMKKFDFLFLIKLRDFETSPKCSLDEMILEMLKSKLQHKTQYTEELLETVLCNKRCLIIVDGLDEWIHPQTCPRGEVIPHGRLWPECTVLTTTRPWKLSTARLLKADIDRQVEISQLDEITARELESRAVEILNENQRKNGRGEANNETKTVTDFISSVPNKILGHIRYIPFMLLQMICLWFGNNPIGKSLCEVYSNIIELTLTRWLVKTDSGHTVCKCESPKEYGNINLKCMENNRHCQRYMALLLKIGQLAFFTLFNDIREESLLFDRRQVLKYLSEEELDQCLDMGLLSQVKDTTSLSEVRLQLYFPHKTLHEFFSVLFIATNWNNANTGTMSIKQTISNKCTSVSDILEMSEVFVFVCGLNPDVYSDISRPFATIVSTDQGVMDYRSRVVEYVYSDLLEDPCTLKDSRLLKDLRLLKNSRLLKDSSTSRDLRQFESLDLLEDYQRMQVSCFLEGTRNQHPECKIVIEDMFLSGLTEEDEQQALVKILSNSACSLKSLFILGYNKTKDSSSAGEIVRILEQTEFSCLERLIVFQCGPTLLQRVLTSAAHTLKYLTLNRVSLTDYVFSAISGLKNLRVLDLNSVQVSRDSLIVLTLPLLTEFALTRCDLRDSTVTLTLPLLTKFILEYCDLRESTVTLSQNMSSLETITLDKTTVNIPCCRELFRDISKYLYLWTINMSVGEWRELLFDILGKLPKSIHVAILLCSGPTEEEWRNIADEMKASPAFCVTHTDRSSLGTSITFDTVVV